MPRVLLHRAHPAARRGDDFPDRTRQPLHMAEETADQWPRLIHRTTPLEIVAEPAAADDPFPPLCQLWLTTHGADVRRRLEVRQKGQKLL
ncbi:MAG: hypothetical protein COW34_07790, partial [Armatimonadetes bacterium CG17_big_fil_post_rev_8_21_14_2_50_66_6]